MIEDINSILEQNPGLTDAEVAKKLNTEFTVPNARMISQDMILALLIQTGSFLTLRSATDEVSQGFWHAISSGVKEFNLITGHPVGDAQQQMLSGLVAMGAVTENFKQLAIAYANTTKPKYTNVTAYQVKKARNPSTWKPVEILSGNSQIVTPEGDLISSSNNSTFRFFITPNETFTDAVKIRILAKTPDQTIFTLQDSFPLVSNRTWEVPTSIAFKRPQGLAGFRHFKFEYIAPFEGAIKTVEVEGVA